MKMRLVVDLQALQTESRFRGIGRYVRCLSKALAKNRGEHEVFFAVNGSLEESAQAVREQFADILPPENIISWYTPLPLKFFETCGPVNQKIGSLLYTCRILESKPDFVLFGSIFASLAEDFICDVTLLKNYTQLSAVVYDFIPYWNPDKYLGGKNTVLYARYMELFEQLRQANVFFTISRYVDKELEMLFPQAISETIFADADDRFKQIQTTDAERCAFLQSLGIGKNFILYTGGGDPRKNVLTLLEAYQILCESWKKDFQLVVVEGKVRGIYPDQYLCDRNIHFWGYVSDDDLLKLYNYCSLHVFPSYEEGFGFTPLEAIRCGAPALASNTTSIPEVIGCPEALFDPRDSAALAKKIYDVLTDSSLLARIVAAEQRQQKEFSWDISARKCFSLMQKMVVPSSKFPELDYYAMAHRLLGELDLEKSAYQEAIACLEKTFERAGKHR